MLSLNSFNSLNSLNLDILRKITSYQKFDGLCKFNLLNTKYNNFEEYDKIKLSYIVDNIRDISLNYNNILVEQITTYLKKIYKDDDDLEFICDEIKSFRFYSWWDYEKIIEYLILNVKNHKKPIYEYVLYKFTMIDELCKEEIRKSNYDRCCIPKYIINNTIRYGKILKPHLTKHMLCFYPSPSTWTWFNVSWFTQTITKIILEKTDIFGNMGRRNGIHK